MTSPQGRFHRSLASVLAQLLTLARPCPACGARAAAPLCGRCREASGIGLDPAAAAVEDLPLHFVGAYHGLAPGERLSPLGRAVVAFKDRGDRYAGRCVARLFAERMSSHAAFVDAVVPVPSDPVRLRQRGYSPAAWLALALSKRCGSPLDRTALQRLPGHAAQRGLGGLARRANARGAFALGGAKARGYSVVLVDDVVTTGATLREAAACLEDAGAVVAFAAVLACADERILRQCRSRTAHDGTRSTGAARR